MLALRNLLTNDKLELGPDMVEAGLPKVVQQRMTQVCVFCAPCPRSLSHLIAIGLASMARLSLEPALLCDEVLWL